MYYALLLIVLIHALMSKKNRNTELVILVTVLFVFIGFRDCSVGQDTSFYANTFLSFKGIALDRVLSNSTLERGYLIFAWALVQLFPFKQSLLIAQGLIAAIALYKLIKENSENYFFSVLVFMSFGLFGFFLTGIRQSFAISFAMLSYSCSLNKKKLLSLIFWALAISFHTSAIVCGLYYVFGYIWKRKNNIISTLIVMIIFAANVAVLNQYIAGLISRWSLYSAVEETDTGLIYFIILFICCILTEFVKNELNVREDILRRANYVTLILWSGRMVSRTFERPAMFFYPCNVIMLPNAINKIKDENNRRTIGILAILFTIALYIYRFHGFEYSFMAL